MYTKNYSFCELCLFIILFNVVRSLKLPGECTIEQFYNPASMECQTCPANVSMVPSADGFACTCQDHSVPVGVSRCRSCNATEVVSEDGTACVPRRCQVSASGRISCRKCPNDYISVTQGYDGSPLKEVLCVKCARGYKVQDNKCVKCEACSCNKDQIVVRGICVPKKYVNDRPKYEDSSLHPVTLLDIVKHEYLCIIKDLRACRTLAGMCVKNFYNPDVAGPCRLWLQPNLISHKGLPQLTLPSTSNNKMYEEIDLAFGQNTLKIVMAVHTGSGGLNFEKNVHQNTHPCIPPFEITIGNDIVRECYLNLSNNVLDINNVYELFLYHNDKFKPIPIALLKPTGYYVQKGMWTSGKFKKFFFLHSSLSTNANLTDVVYLRAFTTQIKIEREKHSVGSLNLQISITLQYATKSQLSDTVITTLKIQNEMPSAGVLRGLEIWGAILGILSALYAVVQWRGVVRRGGPQIVAMPLLAAAVADALYFAAFFSTVHALSAEAGTLAMTLPLSRIEETVISALVFTVVSLKTLKVLWIIWRQCRCDIFFIDWSEYNPPLKDHLAHETSNVWRAVLLAKEWSSMQAKRRVSPAVTVTLTVIIINLTSPWVSNLPNSAGYKWVVASLMWWTAYTALLLSRWLYEKIFGSPTSVLQKICSGVGLSMLVFQEDFYAHYVHGRYDESPDFKLMSGPLAMCRIVCAPQLRAVYKKLSTPGYGNLGNTEPNKILLTRFLAAFFERALDGLNWVGSERTILERLVDIELTAREGGATSALLYDPDNKTPSCFAVTWWGEEWTLATFDAMLFGSILLGTDQLFFAAVITVVVWQVMKIARTWFGNKNIKEKTEVDFY